MLRSLRKGNYAYASSRYVGEFLGVFAQGAEAGVVDGYDRQALPARTHHGVDTLAIAVVGDRHVDVFNPARVGSGIGCLSQGQSHFRSHTDSSLAPLRSD